MENNISPEQLELYNRIDEILWKEWDPIGISKVGGPRDEYYEYLPDLFRMAQRRATAAEIAEYLHHAARDRMSMLSTVEDHWAVAQRIHGLTVAN